MKIVITGGGGFLGQGVARALLARGGLADEPGGTPRLDELVLFDQTFGANPLNDERVKRVGGDIGDRALVSEVCSDADAVFHLASVVSAGAEADFDLGMRVNVDGMRTLLEACRAHASQPRVVFTSSVAAFGGELPKTVVDTTAATPRSSYGTQKVIGELLVNDYTRKGYLDGRAIRLPTIVIRPGKPNRAASGFMSNILREPIAGEPAACPVPVEAKMWIASPRRAVDALIHAMELDESAWGASRTLNAPGITISVAEALAALERVAGRAARERVRFEPDPEIERIVLSWPAAFETARADRLGFRRDESIEDIIRMHVAAGGA
jgi:D-erythronate 2-dehydrogenase